MEKNPMLEPEYIDRKKLLGKQETIDGEPYVRLWDVLMAPVEDVAPVVHGRWLYKRYVAFDFMKDAYRCSECNTTWDAESRYCPNCGARMDGE